MPLKIFLGKDSKSSEHKALTQVGQHARMTIIRSPSPCLKGGSTSRNNTKPYSCRSKQVGQHPGILARRLPQWMTQVGQHPGITLNPTLAHQTGGSTSQNFGSEPSSIDDAGGSTSRNRKHRTQGESANKVGQHDPEWWVNMIQNGGSTWSGFYS